MAHRKFASLNYALMAAAGLAWTGCSGGAEDGFDSEGFEADEIQAVEQVDVAALRDMSEEDRLKYALMLEGLPTDDIEIGETEVTVEGDIVVPKAQLEEAFQYTIDKGYQLVANATLRESVARRIRLKISGWNWGNAWVWAFQNAAAQWSQAHYGRNGTSVYIDANDMFGTGSNGEAATITVSYGSLASNTFAKGSWPDAGPPGDGIWEKPGATITVNQNYDFTNWSMEQLTKVAIHEIGHTLGFTHPTQGTRISGTNSGTAYNTVMRQGQLTNHWTLFGDDRESVTLVHPDESPQFDPRSWKWSFCNDANYPCDMGEGDCDNDSQCKNGLVCGTNNGLRYGASASADLCEPPDRGNNDSTAPLCPSHSTSSSGRDGEFCDDAACPCEVYEGDCDRNAQCGGSAVCGKDNGIAVGLPKTWDVCKHAPLPGCSTFSLNSLSTSFCTANCPCTIGEGDCDNDSQCRGNLVCGTNNGPDFGMGSTWDVCVKP